MKTRTVVEGSRRSALNRFEPPQNCHVQQAAERLALYFDSRGEAPKSEDLSAVLERFIVAHSSEALGSLSRIDWSRCLWGIWSEQHHLAKLPGIWEKHLPAFFDRYPRRSYLKNLILAYLRAYSHGEPSFHRAAALIKQFLLRQENERWIWAARHNRFGLFSADSAPTQLAVAVLNAEHGPLSTLCDAGIDGVASKGGMEAAAFNTALSLLDDRLNRNARDVQILRRLLTWAEEKDGLRFPSQRPALAEALLIPWRTRNPDAEIQDTTLQFLLKHYRDPRIFRAKWVGVSEVAQQVARRWLTRTTLDEFINVVTKVAKGSHWRYRKAFWMAYYEREYIQEAWVLFGKTARYRARQAFDKDAGFGRIEGGLSNHCVLLLKLGTLTIADWSHDGACRIWIDGNRAAPALYREQYSISELQYSADFERAHHGSETSSWQDKIAAFIYEHTRARVPQHDRMP
jgi:hypothetical protein